MSAEDHGAKLDWSVRVGTSSKSFGSAKLIAEDILTNRVRRIERHVLLYVVGEAIVVV